MAETKVYLTSNRDDWETPEVLMYVLHEEFGTFDLDPAASPTNKKGTKWYTKEDDGLSQPWFGKVFVNPPYGRRVGKWPAKAVAEMQRSGGPSLIVMLIASRTDTTWWHDYIMPYADEVRLIRGRLKHELDGVPQDAATFPSAIVVFRRRTHTVSREPRFFAMDLRGVGKPLIDVFFGSSRESATHR